MKLIDIINELEINKPKSNLDILKEMTISDGDINLFDVFAFYDNYDEYIQDKDVEGLSEDEKLLAKIFYKWVTNNDIWYTSVEDHEDEDHMSLPKSYSKMITWGKGYNDVRIILHNFT